MKNRRKVKDRPASDLERFRNLCDALSEDALHAQYAQPIEKRIVPEAKSPKKADSLLAGVPRIGWSPFGSGIITPGLEPDPDTLLNPESSKTGAPEEPGPEKETVKKPPLKKKP